MEGEGRFSTEQQEERELPNNVEEVFPGGFRITKGMTVLDVPESWALYDGDGLLVIDPGGELPIETPADALSLKSVSAAVTLSWRSDKIEALRALEEELHAPVKAILLTHGDADHTNNLENISDPSTPIYVDKREWWSTLSPEKQFAAGAMKYKKSDLTAHDPAGLAQRDAGFQAFAAAANNPRGGEHAHERKRELAARFRDYPEEFILEHGTLQVVEMPGHAPGERGFYIPEEKLFIGGDLLTTSKKEQADRLNIFLAEANIYDAIASLEKLQHMDIERYYPAHGPPIVGREEFQRHIAVLHNDASRLVDRILEQAEKYREENVHQLVDRVFTSQFDRRGMSIESKKSWIMSVLHDRPHDEPNVDAE